jgi:ferric-dicitrate binding protein FerR (iron transport regulator)
MPEYSSGKGLTGSVSLPSASNLLSSGRQATALLIVTTVLCLYAPASSDASKLNAKQAIGAVTVHGVVQINGSPVISGQTLFTGSSIRTSPETDCTLALSNLVRFNLEAETSLTLETSELGLSASLDNGAVRALVPGGVQAAINTADASITTDPGQPALFSVNVDSCSTTLSVQTGRVEIRSANYKRSVAAGESLSTGEVQLPSGGHSLNNRKKAGLLVGIGGAIAILLIALTGEEHVDEMPSFGGCVIVPSGETVGGC